MTKAKLVQRSNNGRYYLGDVTSVIQSRNLRNIRNRVQLILTSPPFPLNNKKSYGNLQGEEYLAWFTKLAPLFADLLTDDGSIIIEMGNNWESNRPVQSLLSLQSLLSFVGHENAGLRLIQEFICYNPSRLPSPAQWVTVNRYRTVDSYTHVWWMAKSDFPKADNSKVLRPYSKSMKDLLAKGSYNAGQRPSEHIVSEKGFLKDLGGSIAQNFFEIEALDPNREVRLPNAFSFSNTASNDFFLKACKEKNITPHPARMPRGLAAFFIRYLTDKGDLVLDPFAGSNTTGYTASRLGRKWIAIDVLEKYVEQSIIRFSDSSPIEEDDKYEHQQTNNSNGLV